ncbi:MAG: POTRA domain-containing protein [Acidobacteriota bacterium]
MPKRMVLLVRILSLAFIVTVSGGAVFAQEAAAQDVVIEDIEIRGNRRIPRDSILYYIQSKPGDRYNPDLARI